MSYAETLRAYQAQVNGALEALSMAGAPDILRQAMRYSLLAGGKRLRGVLALAACQMAGGKAADALPFACALEMIHTYSLIHDDLPAMDNDTLRRGKPTNHVVYGEAMAILAGDGLLTHAFELMAAQTHPAAFAALGEIARAAGIGGMLRGQTLDVTLEGTRPTREQVEQIHLGKTAAMITAPVTAGLLLAGASPDQIAAGREYGKHLGVAFQIVDDLLDLEGDPAVLGKSIGKDQAEGKLTWPACVGAAQARMDAETHLRQAAEALACFGEQGAFLRQLALENLHRAQ